MSDELKSFDFHTTLTLSAENYEQAIRFFDQNLDCADWDNVYVAEIVEQ